MATRGADHQRTQVIGFSSLSALVSGRGQADRGERCEAAGTLAAGTLAAAKVTPRS